MHGNDSEVDAGGEELQPLTSAIRVKRELGVSQVFDPADIGVYGRHIVYNEGVEPLQSLAARSDLQPQWSQPHRGSAAPRHALPRRSRSVGTRARLGSEGRVTILGYTLLRCHLCRPELTGRG